MAIASKCCPPAPQLPWLMLHSHPYSLKDNCFLSLSDEKIYKSSNPTNSICTARYCVGSVEGWLIMVESDLWRPKCVIIDDDPSSNFYTTVNFFLNPISGAQVMLPSQSTIPCPYSCFIFFLAKVVASSPPTSSLHSCLVACICSGHYNLAFCRPTQKSWTLIHLGNENTDLFFRDIEIIDQKIYAATWKAGQLALIVFDIDLDASSYRAERFVILHPRPCMFRNIRRTDGVENYTKNDVIYLAKDSASRELYMIFRTTSHAYDYDPIIPWDILGGNYVIPPQTEGFQVFKLDHGNSGHSWKEVFDFGDQILFVCNASNKFISATDLGAHNHKIVEGNCIYFAFDYPYFGSAGFTKRDFGMFSMTNKTIKPLALPNDYFLTRLVAQSVWFTPHPW
ncbi:uncharacterized protein LOC133728616 [Rosa rugosa]|uniref:uncharacterized protein LOC133728616 n=1 Tax=Rosa rugosa TaxID=74645 RepID=UPI002B4047C5|nr:uncharacterized protein LOC133728616 [Rosa rugosa]